MSERLRFIDLFCGIGGFHVAMKSLGAECVFASDIDASCRETYFNNHGLMPAGDITKVAAEEIPPFDVLCGGFPCQAFSIAGNKLGMQETRGTLFFEIARIAQHHRPRWMILENVKNLAGHDGGRTWSVIHKTLDDMGYSVDPRPVIFSPHRLGIPQNRERFFILCQRKDLGPVPTFDYKSQPVECSIDDVLLDESEISDRQRYELPADKVELIELWNAFVKGLNEPPPGHPIDASRFAEPPTDEQLAAMPDWKRVDVTKNMQLYARNRAFIDGWLGRAAGVRSFRGSRRSLEWGAAKEDPDIWDCLMQYRQSGLRVKRANYFPTLVAINQTSIVGPRRRYVTPRECARMQSFPDDFVLHPTDAVAYKQLGNSVNVEVVRMFAKFLIFRERFDPADYGLERIGSEMDLPRRARPPLGKELAGA